MKRMFLFILLSFLGFSFSNAQDEKAEPREKSIVNKEFDENGNLIKYDSTFVWSWSGDSAFQSEFPMNDFFAGKNFPGFDEMFADSAFVNHFNHPLFDFKQFENDDFFGQFERQFPDSAFSQHFEFFGDSTFVFPFDFGNGFENDFFSKDFEQLHEQLKRHLGELHSAMPRFESEEQQKAWEELMQKQQKEKEELLKKWKED